MVGGVSRTLPDGMRIRGDIHLCLMGAAAPRLGARARLCAAAAALLTAPPADHTPPTHRTSKNQGLALAGTSRRLGASQRHHSARRRLPAGCLACRRRQAAPEGAARAAARRRPGRGQEPADQAHRAHLAARGVYDRQGVVRRGAHGRRAARPHHRRDGAAPSPGPQLDLSLLLGSAHGIKDWRV